VPRLNKYQPTWQGKYTEGEIQEILHWQYENMDEEVRGSLDNSVDQIMAGIHKKSEIVQFSRDYALQILYALSRLKRKGG
jgi:hypothetical protein